MKYLVTLLLMLFPWGIGYAQIPGIKNLPRFGGGSSSGSQNKSDTSKSGKDNAMGFEPRDDKKDSITLSYRFLDSVRINRLDSSINDFDRYFSVPSSWQYLGNNGAAAYPLIYQPNVKAGWDAGLHAYDIYRFKLEDTKFYKTTKPFTQLGYQLASGKEQMIKAIHTQNPGPTGILVLTTGSSAHRVFLLHKIPITKVTGSSAPTRVKEKDMQLILC